MNENCFMGQAWPDILGVMILVGYLVKDRNKTSEDYLVAGRSGGLFTIRERSPPASWAEAYLSGPLEKCSP